MGTSPDIPGFGPDRCEAYLAGTAGSPPRQLLLHAIELSATHPCRRALDIGCGPGREVVELLRAGFAVHAFDPYPIMIEQTRALVSSVFPGETVALQLDCARLEHVAATLPRDAFGLIHAGFVLPFVPSADFASCFDRIRGALAPRGVFVGQFFGPDDEFIRTTAQGAMSSHQANELPALLDGFDLLTHEEVNRQGSIGRGIAKWWQVHHVIARKK